MTTQPPSGTGKQLDDGIEDSIDDSLDELVLQAKRASLENPVKAAVGSHEASDGDDAIGDDSRSDLVGDVAVDIALDDVGEGEPSELATETLRAGALSEVNGDADSPGASIPIPDVISADSPDDVPRGGFAGAAVTALPVREEDVVVSEDEVRVKVESVPHDEAAATGKPDQAADHPASATESAQPAVDAAAADTDDGEEGDVDGDGKGDEDTTSQGFKGKPGEDSMAPRPFGTHEEITRDVVTPVAARPAVTDEQVEEETKVEPYVTAMRAAASMTDGDEPEAGLATQAREERDRALRQSAALSGTPLTPPTASQPVGAPGTDFDDSENDLKLDDDTETETPSELIRQAAERDVSAARGATPPPGYPGRRLPTPSPGILQGPASAALAALATNPGLARMTPSKTMPGVKPPSSSSAIFNTVRLPLGGLLAVLGATFGGGLLIGAVLWRVAPGEMHAGEHNQQQPTMAAPAVAAPPAAEPVPAVAAEPTPAPAAAAPTEPSAPATAAAAAEPSPSSPEPAAATATAPPTPPVPTIVPPRPVAAANPGGQPTAGRGTRSGVATAAGKPPVRPKRTASAGKSKTTWVDPFAQ